MDKQLFKVNKKDTKREKKDDGRCPSVFIFDLFNKHLLVQVHLSVCDLFLITRL